MSKKIGSRTRKKQYQAKYNREFPRCWFQYCKEQLELVENWDNMLNDTSGQRWHLHHRDEIQSNGVVVSREELISSGEYYNLPVDKLIFMTAFEHKSLHHSGERSPMYGKTGDQNPMYGHNKYGITEEDLYELYVVQGLSLKKIGKKFGCGHRRISWYLIKFGIRKQAV